MRTDRIKESQWPGYLRDFLRIDDEISYAPILDSWHHALHAETMASFAREASPHGQAWPEWMWQSLRTRGLHPGGHDTLHASGRLYNSLFRGGPENVDHVAAKSSSFGTSVPYAGVHQTGGSVVLDERLYPRSGGGFMREGSTINLPPRPFLGVTEQMADSLAEAVADHIVEQMGV